jgi:hypothetical protein
LFIADSTRDYLNSTRRLIRSNKPELELLSLYAFRNKVDSLNIIRHTILEDYWKKQRLQQLADTGEISSLDTMFYDVFDAVMYQDTVNIDSILEELSPYDDSLLNAIDMTINRFRNHEYLKWIKKIRNDTMLIYLVNIDGDSLPIKLYEHNPKLIRFGLTDYWGTQIPAVIRNVEKRSFKIFIDDAPEMEYEKDEKAKQAIRGLTKIETERKLTIKPIVIEIKDPIWSLGGNTTIDISQVGMHQWAQGGDPSMSVLIGVELFSNYKKGKNSWDSKGKFKYGRIRQGRYADTSIHFRSNEDKIELASKYGYKIFGQNYLTLEGDFKSQFAPTYQWKGNVKTEEKISDFMSPGYITFSFGLDYKPNEKVTIFVAPLTLKSTYVLEDDAKIKIRYSVDTTANARHEIGARIKASHNAKVWNNIEIKNSLELFSNYVENIKNIDVNWELSIVLPVNDYIKAKISTNIIYDDDTMVPKYDLDENGLEVPYDGRGMQFREMLAIGFAVKF